MSKKYIQEIFWLRAIACLSVVMIHAISQNNFERPANEHLFYLELFQVSLMFATPIFIFISEFLIARNYKNGLPDGFFKKRLKILGIPYISMGLIYAVVFNDNLTIQTFIIESFKNIFMGMFIGYFILIIIQFYILHYLLHKKMRRWNPWLILFITFIINILYVAFFNFTSQPDNLLGQYIWVRGYWLLVFGWVFYFALGYYMGLYYEKIVLQIRKRSKLAFVFLVLTLSIVLFVHSSGILDYISSKRFDLILYTTAVILFVIFITSKIEKTPRIIIFISNYSFSIFLLHRFTVSTIGSYSDNDILNVLITFIIGVVSSIMISYIINFLSFGKYLVGQPYKAKS